jgi:hypothetical protein
LVEPAKNPTQEVVITQVDPVPAEPVATEITLVEPAKNPTQEVTVTPV